MLAPISGNQAVRKFATYDFEWVPGTLKLRIAGFYNGFDFIYFRTIEAFLSRVLTKENSGLWFYAHAGGLADFQFILESIIKNGKNRYTLECAFSGSSAIIVKVSEKGSRNHWTFIDSYWLLRSSLAKIGKSIGIEKTGPKALDNADDFTVRQWYATVPDSELVPYCKNDCVILYRAIEQLQLELLELGGQLQVTAASCAMFLFRRNYLSEEITTGKHINSVGRLSYFASRVEVLEETCDAGYYYDINSSFPYAMTKPVPGNYLGSGKRLPDDLDGSLYMAEVDITIPESFLPPIPTRLEGRLFFPFGSWRTWLTGIDIALLVREGGRINRVYEVMKFAPNEDLKEYAHHIYSMRAKATDPFRRELLKLLLNSLYGKFGERTEKQVMHVYPNLSVLERLKGQYPGDEIEKIKLMPGVYVEDIDKDIPHEHVPIAAYITARARRTLYDFLTYSRDCYYCDTDGFATTDQFPTSSELGGLKLEKMLTSEIDDEGEVYNSEFIAPKVYRLRGEIEDKGEWKPTTIVKAKGFSLAKGELGEIQFNTLLNRREIYIERMARIRENMGKGRITPYEGDLKKALRGNLITKRFHYPDGQTRPWHIDELADLKK